MMWYFCHIAQPCRLLYASCHRWSYVVNTIKCFTSDSQIFVAYCKLFFYLTELLTPLYVLNIFRRFAASDCRARGRRTWARASEHGREDSTRTYTSTSTYGTSARIRRQPRRRHRIVARLSSAEQSQTMHVLHVQRQGVRLLLPPGRHLGEHARVSARFHYQ